MPEPDSAQPVPTNPPLPCPQYSIPASASPRNSATCVVRHSRHTRGGGPPSVGVKNDLNKNKNKNFDVVVINWTVFQSSICSKFCITVIIESFEFFYSLFSGMCKFESLDSDDCFRFEVVRIRSSQTDF
jgi:hypothetical protein